MATLSAVSLMQKTWRLLIDTRERKPLPIPPFLPILQANRRGCTTVQIEPVPFRMETADYAVEGKEDVVLVERKGSIEEVCGNCIGPDRRRFRASLDRLREATRFPHLFLEGDPVRLLRSGRVERPYRGLDALIRELGERQIAWHVFPTTTYNQRKAAGEIVARILINTVVADARGPHQT